MKLFLTSTGLPPEITKDFLGLLGKKPKETKVCFIPTAADPEKDKRFLEGDRKRLRKLGLELTEVDLKQEDKGSLQAKLKKCDVIFIEGGNIFYLLKYIRQSGFDKIIHSLLRQGKIYLGASAGSIIAGPNIELAGWKIGEGDKNIVGLKDLSGLSLVPFAIFPHTQKSYIKALEKYSKKVSYPVVALSDKQAVLVDGNVKRIVGAGKEIIFNASKI